MKIPVINTSVEVLEKIDAASRLIKNDLGKRRSSDEAKKFKIIPLSSEKAGIDYINYQMPELILLNFSDNSIDSFHIITELISDPWLNNGGIIAVYSGYEMLEKINELENTNILISISVDNLDTELVKVFNVISENQQFLFQRAMQRILLSNISGHFTLNLDVLIVPCYANLVANYLFNSGFINETEKNQVSLSLVEILNNAIEHGSCEIGGEEKRKFLEKEFNIKKLITEKASLPEFRNRKVTFQYDIHRTHSKFIIRDEGPGFDWREMLADDREIDYLAEHGRGIWLTKFNVEKINYNERGNEVTLKIKHKINSSSTLPAAFMNDDVINVERDDIVCHQGEETTFLYYIAEGEYRVDVSGKTVAILTPEDMLIGEMSFLLQDARSASIIANTPGRLIKISRESFINTIKNQPYYGLFLSKLLAERLNRMNFKIMD